MGESDGKYSFLWAAGTLSYKGPSVPCLGWVTEILTSGPGPCVPSLAEASAARSALPEVPVSVLSLRLFVPVKEAFCVFNLEL